MSFKLSVLSDSMLKRLHSAFQHIGYTCYNDIHAVPGSEISKIQYLAEQYCTDNDLIVVKSGKNNILNGYSVSNCMYEYKKTFRAVTTCCTSAHVAFTSMSYIADNKFNDTDDSHIMNPLIDELNTRLQTYCAENDKAHFIDLRPWLSESDSCIARSHLAVDGLHYSRAGLMAAARGLIVNVEVLKSAIVELSKASESCDSNSAENDDWPELPKPDKQSTVHPAAYPGQEFVSVYRAAHKQTAATEAKKPPKVVTYSNATSNATKAKRCKQYVHSSITENSSSQYIKSKSSVHTDAKTQYKKQCKINNNHIVLSNRFSLLYCDELSGDDRDNEAIEHDQPQCQMKVHCTGTLKNKSKSKKSVQTQFEKVNDDGDENECERPQYQRKVHSTSTLKKNKYCSRTQCTNGPCKNKTHAVNTENTENRMFTNPYRVSNFSTLRWTKSCFIQNGENTDTDTCSVKEVRRMLFRFHVVPRFLHILKLSVSEPLVNILLQKYGINVPTTNRINVNKTTTMFNDADNLINCMLKVLHSKTQPAAATFMRVIHETGNHLLKYNNLYGTNFISLIDKNALSNICVNKFDTDLLLLCGDIESNPGPRKSTQRKQNSENSNLILSRCMSNVLTSNKFTDCFGNVYSIIKMPGSGFCGFHCLAYSLIGNCLSHSDIIQDTISVFANMPDLFRQRTNFGARSQSSLTLSQYDSFMRDAIQQVQSGFSAPSDAWCEDGHFGAISLLYDVAVCTYSVQSNEWYVFNESATRGYICLLNSPGHFDVLHGIDAAPVIPVAAYTHGTSRHSVHSSDEAWQCLQRDYRFEFVHKFPEQFAGINILNNPVVLFNADITKIAMSSGKHVSEVQKSVLRCDCRSCNYTTDTEKSLAMHKMRAHKVKKSLKDDSVNRRIEQVQKSVLRCDYRGCNYTTDGQTSLAMHKTRVHKVINSAGKTHETCTSAKKGRYICDVIDCASVQDTAKGLAIHKAKRNAKRVQTADTMSVESDSLSVSTVESTSTAVRKSARIHNKRKLLSAAESESDAMYIDQSNVHSATITEQLDMEHTPTFITVPEQRTSDHRCDYPGCNYIGDKISALIMHKRKSHKVTKSTVEYAEPVDKSCSRGDGGIAERHMVYPQKTHETCTSAKKGRYMCDVIDCGSVHDTANGLAIHKAKRHAKRVQTADTMSVESDSLSVSTVESTSTAVRKSARIHNKHKLLSAAESESDAIHIDQSNVHSTRINEELDMERRLTFTTDSSNVDNTSRWHRSLAKNSRKDDMKSSFRDQIAELEKQFMPQNNLQSQIDPLHDKLKTYHDVLIRSISNTTTEKLSAEIIDVILNPAVIDDCDRRFHWSTDDEKRLNELNKTCKLIQPRDDWTWGAPDDSERGQYNDKRMQLCITKECEWKLIDCENCGSAGLLVGDQMDSEYCYDCVKLKRVNEKERQQKHEAWNKVKPTTKEFPKAADGQDLPYLQPGDKAVIAPIHPVVTLKKNHYGDKRMRLESISLVQDPLVPTWCKVLPRTSLADRFMIIERRVQNADKYIVANADRVRQWLRYLFLHHKEFIRLRRENQLAIDEAAIEILGPNLELAEVDSGLAEHTAPEAELMENDNERADEGLNDATVSSGFSETHVFSFDRYPELYLKSRDVLRLRKEGKLEIVQDSSVRKPTYCTSANLAFPHLYPHGEMSPLDFQDYKLGRYLLKKQALYAHEMGDGRLQWNYAEDDIHMAHQYSRLSEQTVRATVGYYISSHPSVAHVPLNSILTAFRNGVDQDSGLLDSHLPDLTTIMSQLPNSRQKWFSERLGIEAISRDIGSPNVFMTINLDPRASPDVRRLIHKLEYGKDMDREEPFVKDTAEFTKLINKYAPFVAIFLYRKVKAITRVFFTKICGIPEKEVNGDWMQDDITESGWFWGRVEFTETRGVQHWHFLVKLPHVLDTGLLGRIIHNGRVVRQELKCGNIKPERREQAWHMIEMGLLASRYAALFAHSISTASFYSECVDIDGHEDSKVIRLEDYRKEYAENYKAGNINLKTHPIMRQFDDPECHENEFHEMAQVASVSCLHHCIRGSCGGDPLTGDGCRFDFPKKELKHTVAAVMQVNASQMEARVLLRRTCNRVANLNRYLIRYLRSNHDVSVLIDSAHKLRYATKYCAKSGKHTQLLDEMIEHLNKRSTDLLPPNMKQVLSHLLLADCSHRAFISKQELAYKVMNLPDIMKSFANVDVVGFYKRANMQVPYDDEYTIEYSDRTEYSAYAERCRDDTELGRGVTKEALENMCLNEFAETVVHKWINSKKGESKVIDETTKRKFRTRDVNSGYWRLTLCRRRKHTRPSTVLHTAPAIDYELCEHGKTTTQTTFYDLSIDKRHQLYRAYYELVTYMPWKNTPDDTFLHPNVREMLDDRERHVEIESRHSLQRLEEFFKVYRSYYDDGKVAPPGSAWQKDNQYSYSMYLVSQHNRDIHLDRIDNRGVLKAQYEDVDELVNVDVDIRPAVNDISDLSEYPTFENFMPPDTFRDIMEQKAPPTSEICVAFPLQNQWQRLEELATHDKTKRFIANPPLSCVDYDDMTEIQKLALELGKDEKHQILFLCGKAGSGKTATALKICEHFRGKVQATAYTGKAAALFNGPTIHSMFAWSHREHMSMFTEMKPDSKKVTEFRVAHENIALYVIEEALAIPPACFALMDEMMTAAFNPKHNKNTHGELPPFGGKKMLFLGDQAQLPPIGGPAVYDDGRSTSDSLKTRKDSRQSKRTKTGQLIFEKYLVPNCIYLQRGQRNCGLLGEICDRMRQGKLTEDDCTMLTYQKTRFPDVHTDFGIHYRNEMCSMHNWRQLWNECKQTTPPRRMFICKATYNVTTDNSQIVDALSALPPQAYDYAPDILCVAEGCEVRLLHNVNTAAGLVTSQSGIVVKVIFNNADVNLLLAGEHVVPYCIVVSFEGFQGFVDKRNHTDRRIFPFPNQPTWVPVFRKRFSVKISSLPAWIRKKQLERDCYRIQFPLDLASNITAHRAQGQTMANCLVSVNLGLENPDMKMPPEISSLLYVACTRVTQLENLFVSPIHPCVWQKIGQSDIDKYRRSVDEKLRKAAEEFATNHGMREEMLDELAWTPDSGNNAEEWRLLQEQREPPSSNYYIARSSQHSISDEDFHVDLSDIQFSMFLRPVLAERHIGIDQGVKNFAIAVVERTVGNNPIIVAAKNYTEFELKSRFKAADVLLTLTKQTDLLVWMNPGYGDNTVDRVVVHLEQIDPRNRNSKQFSVQLGKLLQQQAVDPGICIVQMSSPHVHRSTGPLFHLGDEIVEILQLQSAICLQRRSRAESNPSVVPVERHAVEPEPSDVEPSDETVVDPTRQSESQIYRAKKKISSDVFRYIVEADDEQLQRMKLTVDTKLQDYWREKIASDSSVKVDDVGDALLHALDELLCGGSHFKQLVPAAPSVHVNRTVAVAVFPGMTYWVVLNCQWNTFVFENFGYFSSRLHNSFYKDPSTVAVIKANMVQCDDFWLSLSVFEGNATYSAVDHIKVVVKQLTGHTELGLKNEEAGALTDATTKAMKLICDGVIGINSKLIDRRDRILGSMYCRTSTVHRDKKFQVVLSTGKHTNAVLSCLSWMKQNLRDFVEKRREMLSEAEKRKFFGAMLNLSQSGERCMEMLQLSETVVTKLCSKEVAVQMECDKTFQRNIADLVLVAMCKNQQHVKAIAANSRKASNVAKQASVIEEDDDLQQ